MWSHPPASFSLSSGAVHVWRASLAQPPDLQETLLRTLNEDERARADRFHFDQHRRRFVLGRGFLRVLLARYLEVEPAEVRFAYGPYGKPLLSDEHGASRLRFNASHSHELAVYAFVQEREIGIDVEYIQQKFAGEEIARQFFSAYEVDTLMALPESERAATFFRCWTRKEAYIKAIGSGLSHPLDQFDVSLDEPALLRDHRDPGAVAKWEMFNLEFTDTYAGALVVEGSGHSLHRFELP
jgi:4'-phosphopantetheinyl transferase